MLHSAKIDSSFARRIKTFEQLLVLYKENKTPLRDMIDGGAGFGKTSKQMLMHAAHGASCYAFEPYPGNHRFLGECDGNIILHKKALFNQNTNAINFFTPENSIVTPNSPWGRRGFAGYSSCGAITLNPHQDKSITVEAVRADDLIPPSAHIDFIKLDLQGGELHALEGMPRILSKVKLMWIEFAGDFALLDFLISAGFHIFDTSYMFIGSKSTEVLNLFNPTIDGATLSNGKTAWFGNKITPWDNFCSQFQNYKDSYGLIQTDLICVHPDELTRFLSLLT